MTLRQVKIWSTPQDVTSPVARRPHGWVVLESICCLDIDVLMAVCASQAPPRQSLVARRMWVDDRENDYDELREVGGPHGLGSGARAGTCLVIGLWVNGRVVAGRGLGGLWEAGWSSHGLGYGR